MGLISDAFHMFFDCSALLLGLVAAVVARWAPNDRYSYGYVRADTLAGFVNAIFLVFIAFFILSEAIEVRYTTRYNDLYLGTGPFRKPTLNGNFND